MTLEISCCVNELFRKIPRSFYQILLHTSFDSYEWNARRRFQFQFPSLLNILLKKEKNNKEPEILRKKCRINACYFFEANTRMCIRNNDNLFINYLNTQTPHVRPIFSFKYPNNLSPPGQHSSYGIRTHRYS